MDRYPAESHLAYLDVERGDQSSSLTINPASLPGARTRMDARDRSTSKDHRPFITFDFEPDDLITVDRSLPHSNTRKALWHEPARIRSGHRHPEVSYVPIDHFDPKGVYRMSYRCSEVSLTEKSGTTSGHSAKDTLPSSGKDQVPGNTFERTEESEDEVSDSTPNQSQRNLTRVHFASSEATLVASTSTTQLTTRANATKPASPVLGMEFAMREILKRHNRSGLGRRTLGVAFKDLCVFGVDKSISSRNVFDSTVGSILNPVDWIRSLSHRRRASTKRLISGFEGIVNAGEMLLVIGRPNSGRSTLLKALSNETDDYAHVLGERYFNHLSPLEAQKHLKRGIWYCKESAFEPYLTVEQTIAFAARVRSVRNVDQQHVHDLTSILLTVFGLHHIKDKLLGNSLISESEKRRLSICEALAGRAFLSCWDDCCHRLDLASSLEVVRALRIATDLSGMTTIVKLSQAGEALYNLFDKVCVIAGGRMVYYGRARTARGYFEGLGYQSMPRQTSFDFLVSVTDSELHVGRGCGTAMLPRVPDDFMRAFHQSAEGRDARMELMAHLQESGKRFHYSYPKAKIRGFGSSGYPENKQLMTTLSNSWLGELRAVLWKRIRIFRNGWKRSLIQLLIFISQGLVMGYSNFKTPLNSDTAFFRGGFLSLILIFIYLSTIVETDASLSRTTGVGNSVIWYPSKNALAITFIDFFFTITSQLVFASIAFALANARASPEQVLSFIVYIFVTSFGTKLFFRTLASLSSDAVVFNALAALFAIFAILYSGFALTLPGIDKVRKVFARLSPLRLSHEGLLIGELHGMNIACSSFIPQGIDYADATLVHRNCDAPEATLGLATLKGDQYLAQGYGYVYGHLWVNAGFSLSFAVICWLCFVLTLNVSRNRNAVPTILYQKAAKHRVKKEIKENLYRHLRQGTSYRSIEDDPRSDIPLGNVFTWRNLSYARDVKGDSRIILDGVSGYLAPRKMCALMGECGVGKSTLLDVLAGRLKKGSLSGDLTIDGKPIPSEFQSQIGFVQQNDVDNSLQTVREALLFSARLRESDRSSRQQQDEYISSCLRMCGLDDVSDAIIGTLSLEKRKRASIAIELAAQPRHLLFLDEPTSGLDSQSALAIVALLRDLANVGQAIFVTLQRPSCEIFQHFDQALVLGKNGKTIYFGEVGLECETIIKYFESNGAHHCDTAANPAEWMMDSICAEGKVFIPINWPELWLRSSEVAQLRTEIEQFRSPYHRPMPVAMCRSTCARSWIVQFFMLLARDLRTFWRRPALVFSKLLMSIFAGLLVGFTYRDTKFSLSGTYDRLFSIVILTVLSIPMASHIQSSFIEALTVFEKREQHCRLYHWSTLLASQLLSELLLNTIGCLLLFITWFCSSGLEPDRALPSFIMLGLVYPLLVTTFAMAIAVSFPKTSVSSVAFSAIFFLSCPFDRILQPVERLGWWRVMTKSSPFSRWVEATAILVFGGNELICAENELIKVTPPAEQTCIQYLQPFLDHSGGYLSIDGTVDSEMCYYCTAKTTTEFFEKKFSMAFDERWRNVLIVIAISALNIILMFLITFSRQFWRRR